MLENATERTPAVPPELGRERRARRKELALTMEGVADAATLPVGVISDVERGLTAPSVASRVNRDERLATSFPDATSHAVIVQEPSRQRTESIGHRAKGMLFILAGQRTAEIERRAERLLEGDSIHVDSTRLRHSSWNHATASCLWCGTMDLDVGNAPRPVRKRAPSPSGDGNALPHQEIDR